jgi:hypothetical protein
VLIRGNPQALVLVVGVGAQQRVTRRARKARKIKRRMVKRTKRAKAGLCLPKEGIRV